MAKKSDKAVEIVFGNKKRQQFPEPEGMEREKPSSAIEGPTQPLGFGYRLRGKFSEQVSEIDLEKKHKEETARKGMRYTFRDRSNKRPKHLQHPAPIIGSPYKQQHQMERPHYEETEKMNTKSFKEFFTEAAKRGRPRKLRPGEEADTLHIQDQLAKLTHPNHVELHFKDGSKHRIPREHANAALHHLNSLKPIDRADHAEHMSKGHAEFYHVLTKKSIPDKKPKITLAGPKLRKEEVELEEMNINDIRKKMSKHEELAIQTMKNGDGEASKKHQSIVNKLKQKLNMKEEADHDDGWYAHKEMHGSNAVSKEDWKRGIRLNKDGKRVQTKKEEVDLDESTKDKLQRYVQGAKSERHDPVKGEKRKAGINLALKKIIGSDPLGRKPKVKATTEEVEQVDEVMDDKWSRKSYGNKVSAQLRDPNTSDETRAKRAKGLMMVGKKSAKAMGLPLTQKEEIEYTAEELELYESLSDEHKAIFEKMDREELNKLMKSYKGKITKGEYNQPRESEKPWPASKMKGSKWASTAGSIMRKNQGYKK